MEAKTLHLAVGQVLEQVNQVILGKEQEIREIMTAFLADGHVLLEDIPGVGRTSGVNCTRLYSSPIALEKATANVVFPTPGISSRRTWPRASTTIRVLTITLSFPTTALRTSAPLSSTS